MTVSLFVSKIFDNQTVEKIKSKIDSLENERWVNRSKLIYARKIDEDECNYDFCGHRQMTENVRFFLKSVAPAYENYKLAEIAINRYFPGNYIGKHKDRHLYRRNLVVSLQELGDGLLINETNEFIEDKIGQGVLFEGIGPVHSVPPVKNLRYSLIYLYE